MKQKTVLKRMVDLLMTLVLLFLMGYQFWGDEAHEWAGAGMFVLFILHHILNRNWYRALGKGRYSPMRIFQTIINWLLFLAMLGLMISGMKDLVEKHAPIINRINPAALIADSFYCIAVYDDMGRLGMNLLLMGAESLIFLLGSWLMTRRGRYDSL